MVETKLQLLKKALDEQNLSSDQWKDWLTQASETLWAARQVLEKSEPYATRTIATLKDTEEYLLSLLEECQEGD